MLDKKSHEELAVAKDIEFAFSILNYNQGLIQFADSKANALLLINSIFIASIAPFVEVLKKGGNSVAMAFVFLFFMASILSILLSFGVITTRKVPEIENSNKGLIFYGHIIETRSPEGYIHEYNTCDSRRFRENILSNVFVVSRIASRKYHIYNYGQALTLASCALWIISMIFLLVH